MRGGQIVERVEYGVQRAAFAAVKAFRTDLYSCLLSRGDALFELRDALLCTDGPVCTLVDLALASPSTTVETCPLLQAEPGPDRCRSAASGSGRGAVARGS